VSTGGVLEPRVNRSRELRETLHGWTEGVGRFAAVLILTVALWIFFAATQAVSYTQHTLPTKRIV
jgi:hypothetical protein